MNEALESICCRVGNSNYELKYLVACRKEQNWKCCWVVLLLLPQKI